MKTIVFIIVDKEKMINKCTHLNLSESESDDILYDSDKNPEFEPPVKNGMVIYLNYLFITSS